jgi:acyl-CoA synthetase (AMP-forming)/AMP-acid ligase II/acyl carrier protein
MDVEKQTRAFSHLLELLDYQHQHRPETSAVESVGGAAFTYAQLAKQAETTRLLLRDAGVAVDDAVALVLPDGPLTAAAFVTVATAAATAPLNPTYTAAEFDFYFEQLSVRAVIVPQGAAGEAVRAAHGRNLTVLELIEHPAGGFTLRADRAAAPAADAAVTSTSVALLLHTSGTTAKPKVVPLTHANLCASARNIANALGLTDADRCLTVMPLFHVHGLIGALLSTLTSGGSVVCAPGFQSPRFLDWLGQVRPTWFTAVPTMHQAILERIALQGGPRVGSSLRFIRSCSAALPPPVMARLERTFDVPVVEAYGMTEASHQIATNPLPPAIRKPGSVGLPSGTEIAVLTEDGRQLAAGEVGEIAVQGLNLTAGYLNHPAANASAFTNGWFRTGDQGYRDADGYVFLTGRLKELINRGGEKISPREIDDVLLTHPAVQQAVAFGIPDARLGEVVGAAVVLREKSAVTEQALREFVAARLTFFKVPKRVVFVEQLPKGPTGKLQRIGLAARLGIGMEGAPAVEPSSDIVDLVVDRVTAIAGEVLEIADVPAAASFLESGGDSVLATQFVSRLRDAFDVELSLLEVFDAPSLVALSAVIGDRLLSQVDARPAGDAVI